MSADRELELLTRATRAGTVAAWLIVFTIFGVAGMIGTYYVGYERGLEQRLLFDLYGIKK